jgi:hypothetical protein
MTGNNTIGTKKKILFGAGIMQENRLNLILIFV